MTRFLGVDVGSKRTGLSVGSFGIARPLTVVEVNDDDEMVAHITRIAAEEGAEEIVVGLAVSLGGGEGPAAERQRAIARRLETATGLAIHLWDERLTSAQAERALTGAGVRRRERRAVVDKIAATLILQGYLDARARES